MAQTSLLSAYVLQRRAGVAWEHEGPANGEGKRAVLRGLSSKEEPSSSTCCKAQELVKTSARFLFAAADNGGRPRRFLAGGMV